MPDKVKSEDNGEVSLFDWISEHHSEEELREVFLNMDIALKYIHEHGYCVRVFYPSEIFILNNNPEYIEFKELMELSKDSIIKREMILEDIFNSSFVQIGIYTNSLKNLSPIFLREHFDEITQFLPSNDVPYYRGIVERGASVYFCSYAEEKNNRDLVQLAEQFGEDEADTSHIADSSSIDFTKRNKINDKIYRQINGLRDSAFINFLLIPTLTLLSLLLIGIIGWIISLF